MWTAGIKYSWRKMEAAAQDRANSRRKNAGLFKTSPNDYKRDLTLNGNEDCMDADK